MTQRAESRRVPAAPGSTLASAPLQASEGERTDAGAALPMRSFGGAMAGSSNGHDAGRDRMPGALAQAVLDTGVLLLGADDGAAFADVVAAAVKHVSLAAAMHRATLIGYLGDDGAPGDVWWQVVAEWTAADVLAQISSPHARGRMADCPDWTSRVERAEVAAGARTHELRDDALRAVQEAVGARYILSVPIRIDGRVWGALSFDDCRTERRRSPDECTLLSVAAQMVGLAVHQHQTRARIADAERVHLAALDHANGLLRAAVEASRVLLDEVDLDAAMTPVLALLGRALDVHRVALAPLEPADDGGVPWCTLTHEWTAPGVPRQSDHRALRRTRFAASPEQQLPFMSGTPIQTTLDDIPAPQRDEQRALGVRAACAMPIRVDGHTWGVLGFDDCRRAREWPVEELDFLRVVTLAIAAAIKRQDAERQRVLADARRTALLGAVAQAAEVLTRTPDLHTALVAAGRVLGEATGVDRVNVFRYDHARAAGFLHGEWSRPGVPLVSTVGAGPFTYADYEEVWRVLLAGDVYHSPLARKTGQNAAASTKTDLHVPIMVDGRFWGMLNFDDCTSERTWADGEIEALRVAAEAVAAAVRRGELEAAAREAAARERAVAAAERIEALADTNAALAKRLRLVEAAVHTADALLGSADVGTAMPDVLAHLGPFLGADRAILGRFDPPTNDSRLGWLEVVHEWVVPGLARQTDNAALVRLNIDHYGDLHAQLQAERVVQKRTADLPEAGRAEQVAAGAQSQIVITVLTRGQLWGFLGFDACKHDRVWDQSEVGLLQIVASSIGGALEREAAERAIVVERERAAEQRAQELAAANDTLQGTVASLAAGRSVEALCASVLQKAAQQAGAAATALFLYDQAADVLQLSAAFSDGPDSGARNDDWLKPFMAPVTASGDAAWQALLAAADPLFVHSVADARFTWPTTLTLHESRGHATLGYLRLQVGSRPLGYLGLAWRADAPALAPTRRNVLTVLAQQLALALELDRLAAVARVEAEQSAVLEERTRLARELHDTIAQGLAGVVMQLGRVRTKLGEAGHAAAEEFAVVDELVRDSLSEARRALATLRPAALEAGDLAAAVRAAVSSVVNTPGAHPPVALSVAGSPRVLPPEVEMELFRITQAALVNACQHGRAASIEVELTFEDGGAVRAIVRDDGCGFDATVPRPGRFGLAGMSERAARIEATLAVVTAPDEGTEVVIRWVPVDEQTRA